MLSLLGKTGTRIQWGGGVFILVRDCFIASEQKQFKTNCEIIWVKINIVSAKSLFVAAHCMPKEGDVQSAEELRRSLEMVRKIQDNVWILGDFNYPKFSWDGDHMPSIKSGCGFPSLYDDFVAMLDDFGLVQTVNEPTRYDVL